MASCFVLGSIGVMFTSSHDLCRASLSSHKVLDELYPEVLLYVLKSCINNILQEPHARAKLLYQGVSTIRSDIKSMPTLKLNSWLGASKSTLNTYQR
jgi:hypothetical protein